MSISSPTLLPLTEEGIQTEEESVHKGLGYNPALQRLQDYNQAQTQLECELSEQAQKLAQKYDDCQIKMAKKHEWKQAKMVQESHTAFQEVFAMASLMESIKLPPWCLSSVVPSQYIGEVLATTTLWGKNTPATTAASEPMKPTTLGPSSSPAHCSESPLPIIPLLPDLPLIGTPPVGCPFAEFLANSTQKKWDHSSSSSLDLHCSKGAHANSKEVKAGSDHSSAQGDDNMPGPIPKARPHSHQREQEPDSLPSYPTRAVAGPDDEAAAERLQSTGDQASLDSNSVWYNVEDSDRDTASEDCISCSDTEEVSIQTAHKRYQKRVWASYRLNRSSLWTETQMKMIGENCQEVVGA